MILYLDTSSLVKLFVQEVGSEQVRHLASSATGVATSAIAYAEVRAAFARKRRLGESTDLQHKEILIRFERDWPSYAAVEASAGLIRMAGDLAETHALRGFDAIHLASAMTLMARSSSDVVFSCADHQLSMAALREGLGTEA